MAPRFCSTSTGRPAASSATSSCAVVASGEAAGQDPAVEKAAQLALDVPSDRDAVRVSLPSPCQPGLEVLLHEPVKRGALGTATAVHVRRRGAGDGAEA